jgi:hypothetical protein
MPNPQSDRPQHPGSQQQQQQTSDRLFNEATASWNRSMGGFGQGLSNLGRAAESLQQGIDAKEHELVMGALDYGMHAAGSAYHAVTGAVGAASREIARENPEAVSAVHRAGDQVNAAVQSAQRTASADYHAANQAVSGAAHSIADHVSSAYHSAADHVASAYHAASQEVQREQQRQAAFEHDRPVDAVAASSIPFVGPAIESALAQKLGGLPHNDAHPTAVAHTNDGSHAHTTTAVADAAGSHADHGSAAQAAATDAAHGHGGTDTHAHTATVKAGDGYLRVAKRILGAHASNHAIASMASNLEQHNNNRSLRAGEQISYTT